MNGISSGPADLKALRTEVRTYLKSRLAHLPPADRVDCWVRCDTEFSREVGQKGWIGMTWPVEYGGGGRSAAERCVVLEEMLLAGAPVCAHWSADRQTGPQLLTYGTQAQRERFLPAIARGECFFCIGLSEPGAGSDLAAVRTRADRVPGGWKVNGQKVWTTAAMEAHFMMALVRTDPAGVRHGGLSQLIIDMKSPGLTVRPIVDITGAAHFNEVFLDDVFVPDDMMMGQEGQGWTQVTSELGLERSGPERYITSYELFRQLLGSGGAAPEAATAPMVGRAVAELWSLRQMSASLMSRISAGEDLVVEAAMFKECGCVFEQTFPLDVQAVLAPYDCDPDVAAVMDRLLLASRSFSLRGGTREIMLGVVARGIGLR
jgi:alkylation response protein AidB-like acyl-CoA dehydrogenase